MPIVNITNFRALTTVCAYMAFQSKVESVCLITNETHIRAFTTFSAFMAFQITALSVCLITYITNIRSLNTVCAIMCYQIALCTNSLITYFTWIWTFTTLYITGLSALITLYMKLFIHSILVKNRLNITICFDRKNKYFTAIYTDKKIPLHFRNCYLKKCITWLIILKIILRWNIHIYSVYTSLCTICFCNNL